MARTTIHPSVLTYTLRGLSTYKWSLVGLLVLAALALFLVPSGVSKSALVVVTGAFSIILISVVFVACRDRIRSTSMQKVAAKFVDLDASPSFVTDGDGVVIYRNKAAGDLGFAPDAETLVGEFKSLFANPASILYRLQDEARMQGAAREDIVTRKGQVRLAVHAVEKDAYLWRLEHLNDRGPGQVAGLSVPMMTIGGSGTILFMNEAFRKLCGGRKRHLDQVLKRKTVETGDVQIIDGKEGPIPALLAVLDGSAGRKEIYAFPAPEDHDVTEIGSGWTFFEKIPVPMMKFSATGDVLHVNTHARDLLGLENTDDLNISDVFDGLGRPVINWLKEIVEGRGTQSTEFVRVRNREKDIHVQVAMNRVLEDGVTGLIAVMSDATELKSLEAKFVQSQKMEAIGQLAGGVAHDFNNLLTAISGHCDLLLLRHGQEDNDYGDLIQIHQNANRAASLVGQLLAFSRKQTLKPRVLDVQETLTDLTHLLNRLVGEKISLVTSHEAGGSSIRVDKRQLEQVMMNLVVNARDAMPDGGQITVETHEVTLKNALKRDRATVPPGDYVMVSVKDEGDGIPAEVLPKIFEPFFTTKRQGEGTGLGLSTVYGIVKQTGGFVFVESKAGNGTTFHLYFPAHSAETEVSEAPTPKLPPRMSSHPQKGVVLLVEDEAPVRAFASRALRLRGYTVIEADCAEQALDILKDDELHVDLFVTDVIMPGMDGPSWVKIALQKRPNVKVVFVSGYAEDSFDTEDAEIEQSVFLPKPFSLSDLTDTVQNQLVL